MMEPLKVTFHLGGPAIRPEQPIHLDGLLAYAAVQEALLSDRDAVGSAGYDSTIRTGLHGVLENSGVFGVYQASVLLDGSDDKIEWLAGMVRRTEDFGIAQARDSFVRDGHKLGTEDYVATGGMLADFPAKGAPRPMRIDKINLASGEWRNFQFFLPAVTIGKMVAWCIGDPDRIRALLERHIGHIGRRGAAGFGVVTRVEIERDERANELWLLRNLPSGQGYPPVNDELYAMSVGNFHPPYWKASDRCVVRVPIL